MTSLLGESAPAGLLLLELGSSRESSPVSRPKQIMNQNLQSRLCSQCNGLMTLSVSQLLCFVRKKKTCEPVDPQIMSVAGDQVLTIEHSSHNIEFNKKSLEEFYLKSQTTQQHLKKRSNLRRTGESGSGGR